MVSPRPLFAVLRGLQFIIIRALDALLNGRGPLDLLKRLLAGLALPVIWTLSFKQARHIPDSIRPPINLYIMPALDLFVLSPLGLILFTVLLLPFAYRLYLPSSPSQKPCYLYPAILLSIPLSFAIQHHYAIVDPTPFLDVAGWVTYGALHFASPFLMGWWLWFFAPSGVAQTYGITLGVQNLCGLSTHLVFPNAAPWFFDVYEKPYPTPTYDFPGNPAGLVRVDDILGTHLYGGTFKKSPVVFGAFPSLHAATATVACLYVARYSPVHGLIFTLIYWTWMCWSTMYFHHHWAIDLMGGMLYTSVPFYVAHRTRLRRIDAEASQGYLTDGWSRLRKGTAGALTDATAAAALRTRSPAVGSYSRVPSREVSMELSRSSSYAGSGGEEGVPKVVNGAADGSKEDV